jgi:uncharacterized protein (TIGR03083 family)
MRPLPPIHALSELHEVDEALLELLGSLGEADWKKPTVHRDRDVKDLAAHLLDGALRRLSVQRDGFTGVAFEGSSYDDLVAHIQRLNREWIVAARRLSPPILLRALSEAQAEVFALFEKLDPHGRAVFGVAWAGEQASENWFDVAREYTEKWHHQQQIRDAVGRPDLRSRRHLYPVIATFVRGLPHAYRETTAPEGTRVQLSIGGEATSVWCLTQTEGAWRLEAKITADPACEVVLDDDVAWRLWTRSLVAEDAASRIAIYGNPELAAPMLGMCCIMA